MGWRSSRRRKAWSRQLQRCRGLRVPFGRKLFVELLEDRRLLSTTPNNETIQLFNTSTALFVENQGQWQDESVRFAFDGPGVNIAFRDQGLEFLLTQREATAQQESDLVDAVGLPEFADGLPHDPLSDSDYITHTAEFSVSFDGANVVTPIGLNESDSRFNYFVGDQANWRADVPGYATVAYQNLYDGIDLHTFGQRDSLKYEFHVAPGADWRQIAVSYDGISGLSIDAEGRLHVATELGELLDDAPYIYQVNDGQRVAVTGSFVLVDADTYAFEIDGPYDLGHELVIDPNLDWASYVGGSEDDSGYDAAIDSAGSTFVAGQTNSYSFNGQINSYKGGSRDAFLAKVSSAGVIQWATFLGGSGQDYATGVAVDVNGALLVACTTDSSDFAGRTNSYLGGGFDVLVAKVNYQGILQWATYLGGDSTEYSTKVAADVSGAAYIVGDTYSGNFVARTNTYLSNYSNYIGGGDGFVAKVSGGGAIAWSTYLGGTSSENANGVALDSDGSIVVVGRTNSSNFVGMVNSYNGGQDSYVARLNSFGHLQSATLVGGSSDDFGYGVTVDGNGTAIISGYTFSNDLNGRINAYSSNAYIAKVSKTGLIQWSEYVGGDFGNFAYDVTVDATGAIFVAGYTTSQNLAGRTNSFYGGSRDAFVMKISSGGVVQWSSYLGGSDYDIAYSVNLDQFGNAIVSGRTLSSDFSGRKNVTFGGWDAFVVRIEGAGELPDSGDTFSTAVTLGTLVSGSGVSRTDQIGNGLYGSKDADVYRFALASSATVTLMVTAYQGSSPAPAGKLDSYLRLFDAAGHEIAINDDFSENLGGGQVRLGSKIVATLPAGTYYVGVSGYPNKNYSPYLAGSGPGTTSTGTYTLNASMAGGTLPPPSGNVHTVAGIRIDAESYTQSANGTFTAHGTILLNNVVEVIGTLQFNEATQIITGDAEFWMRGLNVLGDVKLYDGVFQFDTHAITNPLKQAVSSLKVLGMDVRLDTLEFVIAGGVRIQGSITLPSKLGAGGNKDWKLEVDGNDYIEIGPGIPGGFRFSSATLTVPDSNGLSLYGIPFKNTGVTVVVSPSELQIRGKLELPALLGGTTIDLLTDDRHIAITNANGGLPEIAVVGELRINGPVGLSGGFALHDMVFQIDTASQALRATGKLDVPAGFTIDVGIGFKQGWLDYVAANVTDLNEPVIFGPPPAAVPIVFLQDVGAYLEELAPGPPPVVLGGSMSFTAGAEITIGANTYSLVRLDLAAEYDTAGRFTGTGQVLLGGGADPFELASATVIIDKDYGLYVAGNLDYASILDVSAALHLDREGDLFGSLEGTLHAPDWLGGWALAGAKGYCQYLDDGDTSNDFVLVGGYILGKNRAVEINLNTGKIDWNANYLQLSQTVVTPPPPAMGALALPYSVTLPAGLDSAIFQIEWETGDTGLQLTNPSGTITYTPGNVGNYPGVAYYKDPTGRIAYFEVDHPAGGDWTVTVTETTGIGTYTLTTRKSTLAPTITLQSPQFDTSASTVNVTWLDADTDSDAAISLFYDTDRSGADGVLIASGISENDLANNYSWNTTGVPAGDYYIYAVIDDGANVPVVSYATGRVHVVDANSPAMLTGLNVPEGTATSVRFTWNASSAVDLDHYELRLTADAAGETYTQTIAATEPEITVGGLVTGETYRATAVAVDTDGHVSAESEPIIVVVGGAATVASGSGQWQVFADPGSLYSATVPHVAGDSMALVNGPAGASFNSSSGLIQWNVPVASNGWFEVLVHVTHADGTKSVERRLLYADSTNPSWTVGTLAVTAVDDSTLQILAPDGIDRAGVLQYRLERNGSVVGTWQTSPLFTDTGLVPNAQYSYRVQVKDSSPDGLLSVWSSSIAGYTLAKTPAVPILGTSTASSVVLAGLGTDNNSASTTYAVWHSNTSLYVAANGTLSATPVWRTAASWTNTLVTGLTADTEHGFQVIARNADLVETIAGPAAKAWTLRETTPPVVTSGQVTDPQGIVAVTFSEPVAVGLKDVQLKNSVASPVDISTAVLTYVPATNTVLIDVHSFVSPGQYSLTLKGSSVQDLASNLLDGNKDGTTGDDYAMTFLLNPSSLPGDYNSNGVVDAVDYSAWRSSFGQAAVAASGADGNRNGVVDAGDYVVWRNNISPPIPAITGDYNVNNTVDAADYVTWRKTLGQVQAAYHGADGSGNGSIGQEDYAIWRTHFGQSAAAGADAEPNLPVATFEVGDSADLQLQTSVAKVVDLQSDVAFASGLVLIADESAQSAATLRPTVATGVAGADTTDDDLLLLAIDRVERTVPTTGNGMDWCTEFEFTDADNLDAVENLDDPLALALAAL